MRRQLPVAIGLVLQKVLQLVVVLAIAITPTTVLAQNSNSNYPKEKDVAVIPRCSAQALLDADISGNKFISRAEYVNLLLDLAPTDCPVIDSWLNKEPLQDVFESLSCLCHAFGGIDGQNNCCLQAVGVPMLASFAVPNAYYPDDYTTQACSLIDQALAQECPVDDIETVAVTSTEAPSSTSSSPAPTTAATTTTTTMMEASIAAPTTHTPTSAPPTTEPPSSKSPTVEPTSANPTNSPTDEATKAGKFVEITIQDFEETTPEPTQEINNNHHYEEDDPIADDDENATTNDNHPNDGKDEVVKEQIQEEIQVEDAAIQPPENNVTTSSAVTAVQKDEENVDPSNDDKDDDDADPHRDYTNKPNSYSPTDEGNDTTSPSGLSPKVQQQQVTKSSDDNTSIILASLLCVAFALAFALLLYYGRTRQLLRNPWNKNTSLTTDTSAAEDDIGDDPPTPVRSNMSSSGSSSGHRSSRPSSRGRSHSFSSDDEDTSTDEEEDGSDIERPTNRTGAGGKRMMKDGVVRAEFQDALSLWGRRKRRRQERRQRREERKQALSMEHNAPERRGSLANILSSLENDLSSGASTGIRPSSSTSLGGGGYSSAPPLPPLDDIVDIFDDKSDTSSYNGSPHKDNDDMPLDPSIEHWLRHVKENKATGAATSSTSGSVVGDDRSVDSTRRVALAAVIRAKSASPQKRLQIQRQPRDPVLQDWVNQRQQQQQHISHQKMSFGKFSATNNNALQAATASSMAPYGLASSRSYSPKRSIQHQLASSTSSSPTQSPRQNYRLTTSFSPSTSPKPHASRSVPGSPARLMEMQETFMIRPDYARSHSESSFHGSVETKDTDSPHYEMKSVSVHHLDSTGDNQNTDPNKQAQQYDANTTSSNSSTWNPLHLNLPTRHTHQNQNSTSTAPTTTATVRAPPRPSPASQEFYESILRMEPPEEEDSRGNAFAFEAARPREARPREASPPTERYLV